MEISPFNTNGAAQHTSQNSNNRKHSISKSNSNVDQAEHLFAGLRFIRLVTSCALHLAALNEIVIGSKNPYFLRPGSNESKAPFMSLVLEMKIKLPKNAIVASDRTNTVVSSRMR